MDPYEVTATIQRNEATDDVAGGETPNWVDVTGGADITAEKHFYPRMAGREEGGPGTVEYAKVFFLVYDPAFAALELNLYDHRITESTGEVWVLEHERRYDDNVQLDCEAAH